MNTNLRKEAESQTGKKKNIANENKKGDHPQVSLPNHQAVMGEMAGYLAHQWKQPLNTINLILVDIQDALRHNELDQQYMDASVERARKVIDNMVETIDEFRNFFKPQDNKVAFHLRSQVDWALSFIRTSIEIAGIRVKNFISDDVLISGFSNEFSQVMISVVDYSRLLLLANKSEEPFIEISSKLKKDAVTVFIVNNGGIISEKELPGIFDLPSSPGNEAKNGGINLYLAKESIKHRLNGDIIVKNTKKGIEFMISIPLM